MYFDFAQHKQRGFVGILVLVVVVIVTALGGAYYFGMQKTPPFVYESSPSPPVTTDEIASWETYKNADVGYEIKYTNNLKLETSKFIRYGLNFSGVFLRNYPAEVEFTKPDAISISLYTATVNEKIDDLKIWLEKASTGQRVDGTIGPDARNFSNYKVGDIDAVSFRTGQESIWKNVVFYRNNKLFLFSLNPTGETGSSYTDNKAAEPLFDQILSTFRFD